MSLPRNIVVVGKAKRKRLAHRRGLGRNWRQCIAAHEYQVRRFSSKTPQSVPIAPPKPPTPPAAPKKIIYEDLPRAAHSDGECSSCGRYPNESRRVMTDKGERELVFCGNPDCGQVMRPRNS